MRTWERNRRIDPNILRCSVEGCKRAMRAKTLCDTHYKAYLDGKHSTDPLYPKCVIEGCNLPSRGKKGRGLCRVHGCREYHKAHKSASRKRSMSKKYGITPEEYDAVYEKQSGNCAACGSPLSSDGKEWRMWDSPRTDHCHKTGRVRGIIHNRCNLILGLIHDDAGLLAKLIDYLNS